MTSSRTGFVNATGAAVACPHNAGRPQANTIHNGQQSGTFAQQPWARKYVILCFLCGGLAVLLGFILMGIYFTLRSYTSSLHYFETIPTYVPAAVLIITGLLIMCFAKRRNRYSYLIKLTLACLVICTLLCIAITVTTTVIHMNRLQTLKECVYAQSSHICTCYSSPAGPQVSENEEGNGNRFLFNNTPNCEVIHGSLYSCLRGLFGLSVVGILICIFSAMLVYQLLTHEKKKSYWEQMELRRRYFYRRHPHYPYCGCYDEIYPWYPWEIMDDPLWRMSPSSRQTHTVTENAQTSRPSLTSRQTSVSGRQTSILRWLPSPWRCSTEINSQNDNCTQTLSSCEVRLRERQNQSPDPRSRDRVSVSSGTSRNTRRIEERNQPCMFGSMITSSSTTMSTTSHHRIRRCSNDTVLHHLNLVNRYQHLLVANQRSRGLYSSSTQYGEFSLPRHLWGPPPPYPHSPVVDFNTQNNSRRTINTSEICACPIEEQQNDGGPAPILEMVQSVESNDTFGLVDETKQQQTSDGDINGGEIHILTVDVHPAREYITEEADDKESHDRSCLVEIHVPYADEVINRKEEDKKVSSFTLPLRHSKKKASVHQYKSLSNIPVYLNEANMELLEESLMQKLCQFSEDSVMQEGRYILTDGVLSNITNDSNGSPLSDNGPSSPEYGSTIVELFRDYKSRIVIATTPCTPVHDDALLGETVCVTRSMPNLYCSICANSGPVTATTSCCSGSASSIGCSTTSLPDDIFSVEDSSVYNSNAAPNKLSSEDITKQIESQSDSEDQNGNPLAERSVDHFIPSSTSSSDQSEYIMPVKKRKKRSRPVVTRQSALNDYSSSSSDCNGSYNSSHRWTTRNAQRTSERQNRNYPSSGRLNRSAQDTGDGSVSNVNFISVSPT
ncbi:hypothetical protein GQR58_022982 [Nymphon striatum]|nr:hypothetical protein GQR58_022982 [Nymphon striatum]